jgi:hypothetical protein
MEQNDQKNLPEDQKVSSEITENNEDSKAGISSDKPDKTSDSKSEKQKDGELSESEDSEISETSDGQTEDEPAESEDSVISEPPEPDIEGDLAELEKINLLKAIMIKMKGGRHPSAQIDKLLSRHMNFSSEDFQGPYLIRLICTIMMIFAFSTLIWIVLWIMTAGFELTYFQRLLSTGIATLTAAVAGIAIFHPSYLPDEKLLKQAIEQKLKELHKQIGKDISQTLKENEKTEISDLVDATYHEQDKNEHSKHTPQNLQTNLPDDELLESKDESNK